MTDENTTEVADQVSVLLNTLIEQRTPPVKATDLLMIIGGCMVRLRAVFEFDELAQAVGGALMMTEQALQTGNALRDVTTGESVNMLLAEEREELDLEAIELPDTIPEGWDA